MNPERVMYLALGASVIALVIALWAVWEARGAIDRADAMAARLDPIETARADQAGRVEGLQNEVEELVRRIDELEQAAQQPPAVEQPAQQPPAEPELVPAE